MMKLKAHSNGLIGVILLAALWPLQAAAQTPLTIVNPSFETGSPQAVPSGWTPVQNFFWIGDSSFGGSDPADGYLTPQFASASWQYGGLPNANSLAGGAAYSASIRQDIDLSPYSVQIGQGGVFLGLSYAYFDGDGGDLGTVSYDFLNSGGSTVGTGYSAQTTAEGSWQFIQNTAAAEVPTNAATLRITLLAQRNSGSGTARNIAFDAFGASLQPPGAPTDIVNGSLIQFDSDGNWTWYTDERAIVDPNNGHVLVNSVGFDETVQGAGSPGNVDVVNFDPETGRRVRTRLSNQVGGNPQIQNDDHNVGALLVLPDGRYLSMYANHGNNGGLGDEWSRWRRSTNPGDSTSWTTEQLFNWLDEVPGAMDAAIAANPDNFDVANVSYHNLFYLSEEDQVYDISRSYGRLSTNGASQNMPNILRYDMGTNTVEWAGQLVESVAGGYSAYPKYVSNGVDRIYFTTTETHPRNYNNSVFAGYIENGQTFDMLGNQIDADIFDNGTAAGGAGFVPDVTDFTLVQQADALGAGYNRLWSTDLAFDSTGQPMALYTSRLNPNGCGAGTTCDGSTNDPIDHRLHFARWNSTTEMWETQEIAKMGDRIDGFAEADYTGLGALVPGDENTVYISTTFDPRDASGQTETLRYEIYKGEFNGSIWDWSAITENSSVDNLRPIIPDNHGSGPRTVLWFRGNYNTAAYDINTSVVGIVEYDDVEVGLVNYLDAGATNTMFASGSPLSTTGPSGAAGADDDQWHQRTGFGNGGSVLTSNESGTEFAPMLKTTIEGLADGLYDVFAYFWSDNDEDWRLMAGLEQNNLIDFRMYGSQHAEEDQFDGTVTVTANSNDLLLYRAYLGRTEVVGTADIDVFIDDWQTFNGNVSRTWYDGVGYSLVTMIDPGLPGDFNDDGIVDNADYTVWRDNLGAGDELALNGNGDGMNGVDEGDFALWRMHWGETGPGSGGEALASIPEPSSIFLSCLAVCGLLTICSSRKGTA